MNELLQKYMKSEEGTGTNFKHDIDYLNIQKYYGSTHELKKSQHVKIGFWQDLTNARFELLAVI